MTETMDAGNHEGGRNVLFVDSHVEWVTEERFAELIKQDNELRRKRGFAEKPAQYMPGALAPAHDSARAHGRRPIRILIERV
ncbi:MAG TPA: hypothetical protein PLU87_18125 [Sedimentisphaerales bacterium]|nr:hypothetical protein [Sedimentisphaerales bacterium]HRS12930.1 hypothetical protein [Sedimentisphaerales bacterium]HRV49542.1 hypothetical protein [Sedimentisphaerales bacterium]